MSERTSQPIRRLLAMHRLTMSPGPWPSSNCRCHSLFQTNGLHHLHQKGRCCWCCRRFCSRLPTKHRHQQRTDGEVLCVRASIKEAGPVDPYSAKPDNYKYCNYILRIVVVVVVKFKRPNDPPTANLIQLYFVHHRQFEIVPALNTRHVTCCRIDPIRQDTAILFLLNAVTSNKSPPDGPSSLRMGG